MLEVGTRVKIPIAGMIAPKATHEVIGHDGRYLVICPIEKLDSIRPGQTTVPVTRIEEDRVEVA